MCDAAFEAVKVLFEIFFELDAASLPNGLLELWGVALFLELCRQVVEGLNENTAHFRKSFRYGERETLTNEKFAPSSC